MYTSFNKEICHWLLSIIKTNTKLEPPSVHCGQVEQVIFSNLITCLNLFQVDCEKYSNGMCTNTPGSFQCECKPGYHGPVKNCQDLNECSSNKHECSPYANCTNVVGSYRCKCKKGFRGNGRNCNDIEECKERDVRMNLSYVRE